MVLLFARTWVEYGIDLFWRTWAKILTVNWYKISAFFFTFHYYWGSLSGSLLMALVLIVRSSRVQSHLPFHFYFFILFLFNISLYTVKTHQVILIFKVIYICLDLWKRCWRLNQVFFDLVGFFFHFFFLLSLWQQLVNLT